MAVLAIAHAEAPMMVVLGEAPMLACEAMHILVTGGAGFIGSHLVEELLRRSHSVSVLDNLTTGTTCNLTPNEALNFIKGDITDPRAVTAAMRDVDAVVHLAAVASVQASIENPLETSRVNLAGTVQLLEAAAAEQVQQFIFAGSAAVYGNQNLKRGVALREDLPAYPQTPYAIDKLASEQYVGYYHATKKVPGASFRFFNVYGPRQDASSPYSGVISVFHDRLAKGQPVSIFGDGHQTRDFLYVGDLVKLLAMRLENPPVPGKILPIVNFGSGRATSLIELVHKLSAVLRVEPQIDHYSPRAGDIKHSLADTTALKQMFRNFPLTDLQIGLERLVAHESNSDCTVC